jgi:DNA-binding Lrp family transcriptional regulator
MNERNFEESGEDMRENTQRNAQKEMQIEGIDELDNRILEVIRENARLTFSEIGEQVGISRVSVKKRMEAMEKTGIIQGYETRINPRNVPGGIQFFLDIEAVPECYEEVTEELAKCSMIRQIYSVSGECRIHAIGFASNSKNLEYFANNLFRKAKGVRRMGCHTVLSTIKDTDGGIVYDQNRRSGNL